MHSLRRSECRQSRAPGAGGQGAPLQGGWGRKDLLRVLQQLRDHLLITGGSLTLCCVHFAHAAMSSCSGQQQP